MKLTVKELLRELLTKCDLDSEVKIFHRFADQVEQDEAGKEMDYWKSGYGEDGNFIIDIIEFL